MPLVPFIQRVGQPRASTLDRAIAASVAAMLAMNVVVLSPQLHAAAVASGMAAAGPHPVTIA